MEKPRLVLDTNVVLSAVLKPDGLQQLIFQVALSPFCEVFVSAPILTEYEDVLSRKRFKLQPNEVQAVMRLIKTTATLVTPQNTVTAASDPDDNIFLECTEEEALQHINEVVQMVIEELIEDGEPIPDGPQEEVAVFSDTRVAVTV